MCETTFVPESRSLSAARLVSVVQSRTCDGEDKASVNSCSYVFNFLACRLLSDDQCSTGFWWE